MPYTHFRYIAYEVPTATSIPPNGPVVSGFDAGLECPAIARIPVAGTTPDDARKRLKRLAAVVDSAVTRVQNGFGDNANTLKIFIAPEFYFRPPSALGPGYVHDTYPQEDAYKIWEQLDLMFVHANFQDWLIVPGTVMWNLHDPLLKQRTFLNTAMYVTGNQANSLRFIEKKLPSNIDGIPQPYAPGNDPYLKPIYEKWSYRKPHIFPIGGVPCGLEVCLDHANSPNCRVLKTVLSDWYKNEGGNQEISLHLLTAGGMPIQDKSVAAKANGYLLRNDGYSNPPHSELRKIGRYTHPDPLMGQLLDTTPDDLDGTVEFAATVTIGVASISLPNDATRVPMKGNPYYEFDQRLMIYPPQPLP